MMDVVKNFTGKHPKAAKWVWEGGLFVIFSYVVTFLRYIMFQFLPAMFSGYTDIGWGWPSVDVSIFGISFVWNAIGYSAEQGGLAYLLAYLISSFLGECVNFPLQRNCFLWETK